MTTHFLVHNQTDSVGVAVVEGIKENDTLTGWVMETDETISLTALEPIPLGHKIALIDIDNDATVLKHREDIGRTVSAIKQGQHVHVHNTKTAREMSEHIDLDVSGILRREMTMSEAGDALIDITIRTCNGRVTAAEALGHREFVMTKLYQSA